MIRIGIVQFPGSNCERETKLAVRRVGMEASDVMWHSTTDLLDTLDGFIIVGGFSFEDRCRSGAIAAQSRLMKLLHRQAEQGKPILGICNGAQVLVETGLVPGCIDENGELSPKIALADNQRINHGHIEDSGYINDWCTIKSVQDGAFGAVNTTVRIPFAHAQGRFIINAETYEQLKRSGVNSWRYCNQDGVIEPHFPINPNGSIDNLAAISNISGNVLAMMPHPERCENGDSIFASMCRYIEHGNKHYQTLEIATTKPEITSQSLDPKSLLIRLNITDNEAVSVQQALEHLGFAVTINKWLLWQIDASEEARMQVIASNELFNPNKESVCPNLPTGQHCFLVKDKTDIHSQYTLGVLKHQCQIEGVNGLARGVVWGVSGATDLQIKQIIATHLLANPVSQTISQVIYE